MIYYYRRTDKSEKVWKSALPDITTAITTLRLLRWSTIVIVIIDINIMIMIQDEDHNH